MSKSYLYTRTGDAGTTSLRSGVRIAKNSIQVDAYGTVDELNAFIGLLEASLNTPGIKCPDSCRSLLRDINTRMFDIGTYLSTPAHLLPTTPSGILPADILLLEQAIDTLDSDTPAQRTFILPGGCLPAAHAHVARTICRRAERRILSLRDSLLTPSETTTPTPDIQTSQDSQTSQSSPTPDTTTPIPDIAPEILTYLNRLSDYLFILARHLNHLNSIPDTPWLPRP